jgi:hypothetical protein
LIRNQSRDAERAQDDAGFGAPVYGFPPYAVERGHVTYRARDNAVVGPNTQDPVVAPLIRFNLVIPFWPSQPSKQFL